MADKPDFSKIWASNSPLTPYTFTDANYLDGWNFIGSVPPSRGMFDAWMNTTDTKQKYLVDTLESLDAKSYTVDDTQAPSSNDGEAGALFSELAHMIKTASGTSDWKTNPATSLASLATSLGYFASGDDVVWSSKKFTNTKLGVTGLMDSNGYVCFGPNFGGLIIQWGHDASNSDTYVLNYNVSIPLSFDMLLFRAASCTGDDATNINSFSGTTMNVTTFKSLRTDSSNKVKRPFFYLIICK